MLAPFSVPKETQDLIYAGELCDKCWAMMERRYGFPITCTDCGGDGRAAKDEE